jgi:hypothetical protein
MSEHEHGLVEQTETVAPASVPAFVAAPATLPARVTQLQRVVGNRAVNRVLARDRAALDTKYRDFVRYSNWSDAAKYLNGFNNPDIDRRLAELDYGNLGAMERGAADWTLKEFGVNKWDPTTDGRIRDHIKIALQNFKIPAGTKVTNGELSGRVVRTGGDGIHIEVFFKPDSTINADEIAFVQTVRRLKPGGATDKDDIAAYQEDRQAASGWRVDAYEADVAGWYGFNGADQKIGSMALPWRKNGIFPAAYLRDIPGSKGDGRFEAEAVAIAKAGADVGKVYGAVTWGFTRENGKVTADKMVVSSAPTAGFKEGYAAWNAQASNPAKATTGQKALPTLK